MQATKNFKMTANNGEYFFVTIVLHNNYNINLGKIVRKRRNMLENHACLAISTKIIEGLPLTQFSDKTDS